MDLKNKSWISLGFLLAAGSLAALPRPDHVVLVIEENHSYSQIIGNADCPTINQWGYQGALCTQSYALGHPSQPNYLALFAGSTYGDQDDECPPKGSPFTEANLGSALRAAGFSFTGYSEDLPEAGFEGCQDAKKHGYRRKHNPWVNFSNLPPQCNQPFSAFPSDFRQLPTIAFVVANLEHDMHDGTPAQGDQWLKKHLSAYAKWSLTHNSLLIVTWDEDNGGEKDRIPTIFYGQPVANRAFDAKMDHYSVLGTLCDFYGVAAPGAGLKAEPLAAIFK